MLATVISPSILTPVLAKLSQSILSQDLAQTQNLNLKH